MDDCIVCACYTGKRADIRKASDGLTALHYGELGMSSLPED